MPPMNWMKLLFWLTISGLVGLALLFVGLGAEVNRLSCTRLKLGRVDCRLERRFLDVLPVSAQSLAGVSGARLAEDCVDGCVYWVALVSDAGITRLTRFASYNRAGVMADQARIAAFLQGEGLPEFEHVGSVSWVLLLSSVPLLVVAAFLLWWRWG